MLSAFQVSSLLLTTRILSVSLCVIMNPCEVSLTLSLFITEAEPVEYLIFFLLGLGLQVSHLVVKCFQSIFFLLESSNL